MTKLRDDISKKFAILRGKDTLAQVTSPNRNVSLLLGKHRHFGHSNADLIVNVRWGRGALGAVKILQDATDVCHLATSFGRFIVLGRR